VGHPPEMGWVTPEIGSPQKYRDRGDCPTYIYINIYTYIITHIYTYRYVTQTIYDG
jgi:hypothetical protein